MKIFTPKKASYEFSHQNPLKLLYSTVILNTISLLYMAGPTNYLASYIEDHKGVTMSSLEIDVLINKAFLKLLKLKHKSILYFHISISKFVCKLDLSIVIFNHLEPSNWST